MTNYFHFFKITPSFEIDLAVLRSQYISNSKKYHPDFHTLASDEKQNEILELSTLNNEAWKTLSDPNKRMAHILDIYGVMPEEGKAQVPQEFLMEIMDINEALMEMVFDEDEKKKSKVLDSIDSIIESIKSDGEKAMSDWDQNKDQILLNEVRDYYLKLKYINRIKERLSS